MKNQSILIICVIFMSILCERAPAQYVHSAFVEASTAYVALSELGNNFAFANPATLRNLPEGSRLAYSLQVTNNNFKFAFKNELPDFSLQFQITDRITIGIGKSENSHLSEATANRFNDDTMPQHPLEYLIFSYQQDWGIGLGLQLKRNFSAGITMRHEQYRITPAAFFPFILGQDFRTFDIGFRKTFDRLFCGLVLRNIISNRTTDAIDQPIEIFISNGSTITWHPTDFPGIAFKPKFAAEIGLQWVANSHWQILGDFSSRKEHGFGIKWRVFSKFFITAGSGKRFDRVYTDKAVNYMTLGTQLRWQKFAFAATWVIPSRSGRNQFVDDSSGAYELQQLTNHQLLIGAVFSL